MAAREGLAKAATALEAQLARLGPGLTPEQTEAFVRAHRDANPAAYDVEARAAEALAAALAAPRVSPHYLKVGYRELADSSKAETALEWARTQALASHSVLGNDKHALLEIGGLAAQIAAPGIVSAGATPEQGLAALVRALDDLDGPATKAAASGLRGYDLVTGGFEVGLSHAKLLDPSGKLDFSRLVETAGTWEHQGPLGRALLVGYVLAGAHDGVTKLQKEQYAAGLGKLAAAGKVSLKVLLGVVSDLAHGGKATQFGIDVARAERLAHLVHQISPHLGVLASAASLSGRVLEQDKDLGTYIGIVGDTVSLLGATAEYTAATAYAGAVVNSAGMVISAAGDAAQVALKAEKLAEAERGLLARANRALAAAGATPIPQSTIDALTRPNARADLLAAAGFSPEQVQQLVARHPQLTNLGVGGIGALLATAGDLHLPLDRFADLLDRANARFGNLVAAAEALGALRLRLAGRPSALWGLSQTEAASQAELEARRRESAAAVRSLLGL